MDSELRSTSSICDAVMDDGPVDSLLESLADGRLAQRIMDAAQLAVAKHAVLRAQLLQSAVEAEDSAKQA